MRLPCVVAQILANAAEAEASNMGVPMAIAVVDAEGGLQLFTRMDGALPASSEIAVSKAYTAAVLRMPTHEVGALAQPGGILYGIQHTHNGKIILFGGGFPLLLDGEVVGAIGISGGSVDEDIRVAQPVVEMLKYMECWSEKIKGLVPATMLGPASVMRVKDEFQRALVQMIPSVSTDTIAALTGGVLLVLT
jgi:uncharacterized protein GlcG (DUF336 family)